jgi:very-short-patch-repair endonuclease
MSSERIDTNSHSRASRGDPAPKGAIDQPDRPYPVSILGVRELVTVKGPRDYRIAAIAAAQRGRVATRQLTAVGFTASRIFTRVHNGHLIRVGHGVYAVGYVSPAPLIRETEALLACGPGSMVSYTSAAVMWEMIPPRPGEPIHLTTIGQQRSRAGIVVHRSRVLADADVTIHLGLPLTSPARTLLDLCEVLGPREVERALDEALARRIATIDGVLDVADRFRNRKGALALLRMALDRTMPAGAARTKWQRTASKAFRDAGLPPGEEDVWWLGYQHDFLWRAHRVTLEIDGYPWHATKTNMERDRAKDLRVKQAGGDPNRVSNTQVERKIFEVVALVAARLALHDPARRRGAAAA